MKEIGKEWEKMDRLQQTRQFFRSYKIEIWKRRVFIMTTRILRRTYTDKFEEQLIQLSYKEEDNRSNLEKELIELRKRNKQLEMKNDILKQAALILGGKYP